MEKNMVVETQEPEMGLTFEKVWTMFKVTDQKFLAMSQEADKRHQEMERFMQASHQEMERFMQASHQEMERFTQASHQEMERFTQASQRETARIVKKLSRNVGGVNKTLGRLMEAMYSARLWEKFAALGYGFTKGSQNTKFWQNGQLIAEADIFLENGVYAMVVEVKTDLANEDVDDHLDRLATIRDYMDNHEDKRILVGAVAGGIAPKSVVGYAHKKGLHVVSWSGNSATIIEAPPSFKAREWGISGL